MSIVVLKNSTRGGIKIRRWNLAALIDQRWALSLNGCRFESRKHNRAGYSVAWILSDNLSKARWRRALLDPGFLENCRAVALNLTGRDAYIDAFLEATENGQVSSPYTLCESDVPSESGLNITIGGCRIAVAESLQTASIQISEPELEVEILGETKFGKVFQSRFQQSDSVLPELIYSTNAVHAALDDAYHIYNQSLKKLDSLPAANAKLMMRSVPVWLLDQQRIKLKSAELKLRRKN